MASSKRMSNCSTACTVSKWAICALFFVMMILALIGVYQTHIVSDGIQFGGSGGSLSIIAFVVSAFAWSKQMVACMRETCEACDA